MLKLNERTPLFRNIVSLKLEVCHRDDVLNEDAYERFTYGWLSNADRVNILLYHVKRLKSLTLICNDNLDYASDGPFGCSDGRGESQCLRTVLQGQCWPDLEHLGIESSIFDNDNHVFHELLKRHKHTLKSIGLVDIHFRAHAQGRPLEKLLGLMTRELSLRSASIKIDKLRDVSPEIASMLQARKIVFQDVGSPSLELDIGR
jgi:hypothetical protein